MAERASRIVLVLRLKDSLFAPSSPLRFRGESQIRSLDYCLRTHNPCPIQAFSTSLPDFLSHFYFRKRFIFLSTFSLFPFFFFFPPKLVPRSIVNKDTTREFRDSGSFNFGHGHCRISLFLFTHVSPSLSLSLDGPWRGETHESRKNSTETPAVQFVRGSRFVIGFKSRTAVSICGWYQLL